MALRCIVVLAFLLASPANGANSNAHGGDAEVAGGTAHKSFPGSVIGFHGRHDPAEWVKNDPDKSGYEPMGGTFRAGDLTPDVPNAEDEPNDIEDKPDHPSFYAEELAVEKGKLARNESLQGPRDAAADMKPWDDDELDETFLECDAHPERCKNEDLEEEAKQKVELEKWPTINIALDKDDDDDDADDDLPQNHSAEFPWVKAHDEYSKDHPVLAAKEEASQIKQRRLLLDKNVGIQAAGNPDVKIPVAIDYDKLRAEKSRNYDIDCDGPHGDPKNCQKYDGDDIDIESAEDAEFHHMAVAWNVAGMANRNKRDPNYLEGYKPSIDFAGVKNFDADMPEDFDDVDSLVKNGALKKAEEIREEDNVGGHGIDTEEQTKHQRNEAARLAKAHKKKLPKPTQAEKFAIAEKIKLAEAKDAEDTAQKDMEKKKEDRTLGEHKKKLYERKRQKKGKHDPTWSDRFKAYLPWSKSSNDKVAKKTKKAKTNTEKLRR